MPSALKEVEADSEADADSSVEIEELVEEVLDMEEPPPATLGARKKNISPAGVTFVESMDIELNVVHTSIL